MNLECSSANKKTENGTNASPERSSSISQDDAKNWGSFPDKESNQEGKGSVPRSPKCRDLPTVSARPRNPVDRPLIPPKPHVLRSGTWGAEAKQPSQLLDSQFQSQEGFHKKREMTGNTKHKPPKPSKPQPLPKPQHICTSGAHTITLKEEKNEKTTTSSFVKWQIQFFEEKQRSMNEPSKRSTWLPSEAKQSPTPQHSSHAPTETTTTLEGEHSEKTPYISQQRQLYEGRQKQVAQLPEPSFNPAEIKQSPTPQHSSHAPTETTTTLERERSEKTPYISQQRRLIYEGRQKEVPRSPGPSRKSFNPTKIKQSPRPQHRSVKVHLPPLPIGSERRRFTFNSSSQSLLDRARQLSSNRKWCDQPEVCVLELWPPAYNMHTEKNSWLK